VLHGPNLNLLGRREPGVYGRLTLAEIDADLKRTARQLGCSLVIRQYSGEGQLIDAVHEAAQRGRAIVINAGAYSHTSYALRDALAAVDVPKVEVHLTNVHAREPFRRRLVLAAAVHGGVFGFGVMSYRLALRAAAAMLDAIRD
jgi:3-dehydroquinate dehydratase-2